VLDFLLLLKFSTLPIKQEAMTKKRVRQILWDFFFDKSKGKWGAIERIWDRSLIAFTELMLWIIGFFTSNQGAVFLIHLLLVAGFIVYYYGYCKGR
jgi:hypothetical protein